MVPLGTTCKTVSLGDTLTLRFPIVQAPLGASDGPRLAAAVSRAGGLGCLSVVSGDEKQLARRLRQIQAVTPRPFAVAFPAPWQREILLDTCLAHGVRVFQVFWWNGARLAPRIRAAGGTVLWQVGDLQGANEALERGAQVLVAQGTDAGGQVRGPHPLAELVPQLRAQLGADIPLVAGGGLATRKDIVLVLTNGADAALLGTRFLLTEEAAAPRATKLRLLRATSDQLVLDPELVGDWPCAPRRRLPLTSGANAAEHFAGAGLSHMGALLSAAQVVHRLSPH